MQKGGTPKMVCWSGKYKGGYPIFVLSTASWKSFLDKGGTHFLIQISFAGYPFFYNSILDFFCSEVHQWTPFPLFKGLAEERMVGWKVCSFMQPSQEKLRSRARRAGRLLGLCCLMLQASNQNRIEIIKMMHQWTSLQGAYKKRT